MAGPGTAAPELATKAAATTPARMGVSRFWDAPTFPARTLARFLFGSRSRCRCRWRPETKRGPSFRASYRTGSAP